MCWEKSRNTLGHNCQRLRCADCPWTSGIAAGTCSCFFLATVFYRNVSSTPWNYRFSALFSLFFRSAPGCRCLSCDEAPPGTDLTLWIFFRLYCIGSNFPEHWPRSALTCTFCKFDWWDFNFRPWPQLFSWEAAVFVCCVLGIFIICGFGKRRVSWGTVLKVYLWLRVSCSWWYRSVWLCFESKGTLLSC